MDTLLLGISLGATLAIVGDHLWMKHLAKVEARIKAEVLEVEFLKDGAMFITSSSPNALQRLKQAAENGNEIAKVITKIVRVA